MRRILTVCLASLLYWSAAGQVTVPGVNAPLFAGNDEYRVVDQFAGNVEDKKKVSLSWNVSEKPPAEFLTIERSSSGIEFETVGVLKLEKNSSKITWHDEAPAPGKNFYRLKYEVGDRKIYYSNTIAVLFSAETSYKFYPNPVDNILIIRTEHPLEVQISDQAGRVRIPKTTVRGLHTLNVSQLEKGLYVLRITNLLTNTVIQEKLVKN